ncbi:MAG: glycosyltransferase [Spirulina sp. SIO3F2]|nr:glycosyltransferase [Spirulina sp. SIO3F2]
MKILLSAFACEPGLGSEEDVGWHTAVQAARRHEVWVLTRSYCQQTIAPYLAQHPIPNLHFVYFEPFGWTEDWKGRQGFLTLHYYLWQIWAYFVARQLHHQIQFDAAHHVTYCRYWNPSFIAFLPIPFLFGPVGGGESAPPAFQATFSQRGRIYEGVRDLARSLGQLDPFLRLTLRRAKVAIGTTPETAARLKQLGARDVRVAQSLGLSSAEIEALTQNPSPAAHPLRFLTVGRLLHWKGIHLAIRAFAQAGLAQSEYWIIGQGVERDRLEALVQALHLTSQVRFLGVLPRTAVMETMGKCHVLIHPSLHESGGFVCAEMMAAGRPVICFNLGGPAVQVTPETGRVVTAHNPKQAIADLAAAMTQLAQDATLRQTLGQAGQKRVKALYDWSVKGEHLSRIYHQISRTTI